MTKFDVGPVVLKFLFLSSDQGCFGNGPGALKTTSGTLTINTGSFTTYSLTYEIHAPC